MKKKLTRRHKLAITELAIALAIGLAFFCPRTFSGAMGGSFDPAEMIQAQVLLQGTGEKAGDDRTFILTPGQSAYDTLAEMLEGKPLFPLLYRQQTAGRHPGLLGDHPLHPARRQGCAHLCLLRLPRHRHRRRGHPGPLLPAQRQPGVPARGAGLFAGTGVHYWGSKGSY